MLEAAEHLEQNNAANLEKSAKLEAQNAELMQRIAELEAERDRQDVKIQNLQVNTSRSNAVQNTSLQHQLNDTAPMAKRSPQAQSFAGPPP